MSFFDSIEEAKAFIKPYCYPPEDLPDGAVLILNMNDTWFWASAWGEEVPDDKVIELAELAYRYGYGGVLFWVSERHGGMRSEFKDINRFVDFVRHEERFRKSVPDSNKRAYRTISYTLGGDGWIRKLLRIFR